MSVVPACVSCPTQNKNKPVICATVCSHLYSIPLVDFGGSCFQGRLAVCNLACESLSGTSSAPDLSLRKLYIGSLSPEVTSEILLNYFARHGEIEEGSVAYDRDTNESR